MRKLAALDRVEEGVAVLEPLDGTPAMTVAAALLPEGSREGDCFSVSGDGKDMVLEPAPEETESRRQAVRSKLDRLRSR